MKNIYIFFIGCYIIGRRQYPLSTRSVHWKDIGFAAQASWVIGFIGLLAVINNVLGIIMLSEFATVTDVAYFSAAQKLAWPVLAVLTSIGVSFYPVLSSLWPHSRVEFLSTSQRALDTTFLLGCMANNSYLARIVWFRNVITYALP